MKVYAVRVGMYRTPTLAASTPLQRRLWLHGPSARRPREPPAPEYVEGWQEQEMTHPGAALSWANGCD